MIGQTGQNTGRADLAGLELNVYQTLGLYSEAEKNWRAAKGTPQEARAMEDMESAYQSHRSAVHALYNAGGNSPHCFERPIEWKNQ